MKRYYAFFCIEIIGAAFILLLLFVSPTQADGGGFADEPQLHVSVKWDTKSGTVGLNLSGNPERIYIISLLQGGRLLPNNAWSLAVNEDLQFPTYKLYVDADEYIVNLATVPNGAAFVSFRWKPSVCADLAPIEWHLKGKSVQVNWTNQTNRTIWTDFNQAKPDAKVPGYGDNQTLPLERGMYEVRVGSTAEDSQVCNDVYWTPRNLQP